jgi:UDP-2,4-diacetamido-2,4,6-trideoxy-beta-L-altropyranose hydrolase
VTSPRILFLADAGPSVGGGHVMRSLTLARALQDAGATCAFLATPEVAAVLDTFGAGIGRIEARPFSLVALVEIAAHHRDAFDAVVIDHYGLSASDHHEAAAGRPVPGHRRPGRSPPRGGPCAGLRPGPQGDRL